MSLSIQRLFAPDHRRQIVIVERYNVPLVAARPARVASDARLQTGHSGADHNQAPTTARENS